MKDNVVQVNLWDKNVGLLSWDDKRGCSVFQFDKDFMQYGWNIAPLVAPLDSVYNPQNEMLPFHKTKCSETQNEASSL